jgi:hypothetical protein
MKRFVVTAFVSFMPAMCAFAATNDTLTASMLYQMCAHSSRETPQAHELAEQTCISYLRGMTDGMAVMQGLFDNGTPICLPSGGSPIDVPRARQIFTAWLKSHPETGDKSAGLAAAFSIIWAYPCKK